MADPISRLRSVIRGYFTRKCVATDDKPIASAQDTTRKAKCRRTRSVLPSERFVWAMVLLIIALIGLIVLEALYIYVTKSVSAELFAAISALSGSIVTAFLVGKQK
jgi:hypothetical protein